MCLCASVIKIYSYVLMCFCQKIFLWTFVLVCFCHKNIFLCAYALLSKNVGDGELL